MKNYNLIKVENEARVELHDKLELTGSEISFNNLVANTSIPFVHYHKNNEEVYIILEGNGKVLLDGEEILIEKGDVLRISPSTKRQFFAGGLGLKYICIQTKQNSLDTYTLSDAVVE